MKLEFQPVNKQIILKVTTIEEEVTKSGIVIPQMAQSKPNTGIVVKSDHEGFVSGDIVLYQKYAGFQFNIDETEYLCVESEDILVKLTEIKG